MKKLLKTISDTTLNCDRRHFIMTAGAGVIGASFFSGITMDAAGQMPASDTTHINFPPLNQPSEKKENPPPAPLGPGKKLGFALVGLGNLTLHQLMPAFGNCKYAKPVALVSGDPVKAALVASQYGIDKNSIYNYQNYDNIKNNKEIDIVYVVLPNSMHEEFTIRAAKAGKHVLCEKPMADSSQAAQRMIDACRDANRKLMIAYRIQYEPQNRMAMQWTRTNKYGKVRLIEMYNGQNIGDPSQWRLKKALAGGGSLPDIGVYCINTARFLLGEEPDWVMGNTHSTPGDNRFTEVEESALFQMHFPGGTLVNAACCYGAHESRRYRCLADNGAWFGMDPAFPYKGLKLELAEVKDGKEWKQNLSIEQRDQFALEMDHMAQCVMYDRKPFTPGEEGMQDHKIMEAIYQSAKEGKRVTMKTPTDKDAFRGVPPPEE